MKIIREFDLLPSFAGEFFSLTEEEITNIVKNSIGEETEIQEVAFIPRVNVVFVIYGNSRSRVIFLTKITSMNMFDGTLTLDNLENFSFDSFSIKELRHEDYESIADGLSAIIQIKVKNDNE